MELLLLLKAGIRYKKGSFIGIIILMMIISLSMTVFLSIKNNCLVSITKALEKTDSPAVTVYLLKENIESDTFQKAEKCNEVDHIISNQIIHSYRYYVDEKEIECSWALQKYESNYLLLNHDLTDYSEEHPKPKKGEIYVPQIVLTESGCALGDTLQIRINDQPRSIIHMKIAGVIVDPIYGSQLSEIKNIFLSDEDFDNLIQREFIFDLRKVEIYQKKDSNLSNAEFRRQINLETQMIDNSILNLTKEEAIFLSMQFPNIITSVLMIFLIFLLLIVFIVIRYSILASIELDYTNLGILKALGFRNYQISLVFILQYILAQMIGFVVGFLFSMPVTMIFGNVFQPIIGIPAENHISLWESLGLTAIILFISVLLIAFHTKKVNQISPVKAIHGMKDDVYFDSRIRLPIYKNFLSASLGFRQFTSKAKNYISMMMITSILVFSMLTITLLGNIVTSKSAMESMGTMVMEIDVMLLRMDHETEKLEKIESVITQYSSIERKYYYNTNYFNYQGMKVMCLIYKNTDAFNMLRGREPLYENEIVITEFIAEDTGLKIGDKIELTYDNKKSEYIITGIYQTLHEQGRCLGMNFEGAEKFGMDYISVAGYSLSDPSKASLIQSEIEKKYGDICSADANEGLMMVDETYMISIQVMQIFIYLISIIFALAVILMVCQKAFQQEKTDIGIYKALGFKITHLRRQFTFRFFIAAVIGSIIGSVFSLLLSEKVLTVLIRSFGVARVKAVFTLDMFLLPVSLILFCFFLFSYLISGRIKKIDVRELILE